MRSALAAAFSVAAALLTLGTATASFGQLLLEEMAAADAAPTFLYDFGQREADIVAANYRLLATNLAQNRVLQEVANQVEQAYYRVLAFDYLVRASGESLKNFETAFDAENTAKAAISMFATIVLGLITTPLRCRFKAAKVVSITAISTATSPP